MVSNTSELLPEPDTPVNTVSRRLGISMLTSFRLLLAGSVHPDHIVAVGGAPAKATAVLVAGAFLRGALLGGAVLGGVLLSSVIRRPTTR